MANEQRPKAGKAIDLLRAVSALKTDYPKIAALVRSASSAHSIRSDLEIAFDMLETLDAIVVEARKHAGQRTWATDASLALLNSAVILYARATKSSSRHRGTINFRKSLTKDQEVMHERLCRLRDDAIAHFGPGNEYADSPWQTEAVFLPVDRAHDLKIMTGSRRVIEQKAAQADLKAQVHRCLIIAERETQKRIAALTDELNNSLPDDRLRDLLWEHEIDLVEFFETEDERDRAMSGIRLGRKSGYVEH